MQVRPECLKLDTAVPEETAETPSLDAATNNASGLSTAVKPNEAAGQDDASKATGDTDPSTMAQGRAVAAEAAPEDVAARTSTKRPAPADGNAKDPKKPTVESSAGKKILDKCRVTVDHAKSEVTRDVQRMDDVAWDSLPEGKAREALEKCAPLEFMLDMTEMDLAEEGKDSVLTDQQRKEIREFIEEVKRLGAHLEEKKQEARQGITNGKHISTETIKIKEVITKATDVIEKIKSAVGAEEDRANVVEFKSKSIVIRDHVYDAMARIKSCMEKASPKSCAVLAKEFNVAEDMLLKLDDAARIAENYVTLANGTAKVEQLQKDVVSIDEVFLQLQRVYDQPIADISLVSASEKLKEVDEKIATVVKQVKTLSSELEKRSGGASCSLQTKLKGLNDKVSSFSELIQKRDEQLKVAAKMVFKVVESVKEADKMVKAIEVAETPLHGSLLVIKSAVEALELSRTRVAELTMKFQTPTDKQVLREAISVSALWKLMGLQSGWAGLKADLTKQIEENWEPL